MSGLNGHENLIPFNERSEAEQWEIRSKGGKASGESRRRRKTQREFLENALNMKVKSIPKLKKLSAQLGLDDECSLNELLTVKLILNTAVNSNVASLKDIAALLGEQGDTGENNGVLDNLAEYLKKEKSADVE